MRVTAESLGKSADMSVDAALAVLKHQIRMDEVQASLHALDPENYGGAVHAELPEVHTTVFFKGAVPAGAHDLIRGHVGVDLAVTQFSLKDMEQMANSAAARLQEMGLRDVGTGADLRQRVIHVEVPAAELAALGLVAESLDDRLSLEAETRIVVVDGPVTTPAHSYGGGQLRDGSANRCTSAFVVERISNGVDGVLTAEHCDGLDTYRENSGNTYGMSYQGAALTSLGDAEWYTTTHWEYDNFYYTHNSQLDVSGLQGHLFIDVGDVVCAYGRTSGNLGCEAVNQLYVSGSGYSSMIRTDPNGMQLGDSGGPWYVSGTAWGISHGWFSSNNDAVFSSVDIVDGNMGVRLRTS